MGSGGAGTDLFFLVISDRTKEMAWSCIEGRLTLDFSFYTQRVAGDWSRFPGKWLRHQASLSSKSIWTMLSVAGRQVWSLCWRIFHCCMAVHRKNNFVIRNTQLHGGSKNGMDEFWCSKMSCSACKVEWGERTGRTWRVVMFVFSSKCYTWWTPTFLGMAGHLPAHGEQWVISLFCFPSVSSFSFTYYCLYISPGVL